MTGAPQIDVLIQALDTVAGRSLGAMAAAMEVLLEQRAVDFRVLPLPILVQNYLGLVDRRAQQINQGRIPHDNYEEMVRHDAVTGCRGPGIFSARPHGASCCAQHPP